MKIVATIEARLGSSRLPKKVIRPLFGEPMLGRIIERVGRSKRLDEIVVVTTSKQEDLAIVDLAERYGALSYRGSEHDILDRLSGGIEYTGANILVSLTGDNPFVDPIMIDDMIDYFIETKADYVASTHMQHTKNWTEDRTFPIGISVQVARAQLVRSLRKEICDPKVRELGLYAIYNNEDRRFTLRAFSAVGKYAGWRQPNLRMTVDTDQDFQLAHSLYAKLYKANPAFSTGEAIELLATDPELRKINATTPQRLGYELLSDS